MKKVFLMLMPTFFVICIASAASAGWDITQLTDTQYTNRFPKINDSGHMVWQTHYMESVPNDYEIFYYDGNTISRLTDDTVDDVGAEISNSGDIVWLRDDGNDFEKQLISDGFGDEIKKAIASLDVYANEKHQEAKEPDRLTEIESYDDEELYGVITESKTQYGPAIAEQIIQSEKELPPKVITLFDKISAILKMEEAEA